MKPFFSVIVVCLNPGDKLLETMHTILRQTCTDYEVVLKDGGSSDGSIEDCMHMAVTEYGEAVAARIRLFEEKDRSIYDAMNQAIDHAEGQYYIFMNCGDYFYDEDVLRVFQEAIRSREVKEAAVFYGNRYHSVTQSIEYSPSVITDSVCYRNIPCHQTCFYSAGCFAERKYEPSFKVRADYEHFLWCHFTAKASFVYVPSCVCSYEGGGYSDVNAKRSMEEHRTITKMYFSVGQRFRFRAFLILTLQPLRHALATNPKTADRYNGFVKRLRGNR